MGSSQSSTQFTEGSLKQAADLLAQKTQPTREVVDVLFKYMLSELKIKDFYSLTSSEECNKYIMFLGSRLEPLFYDLKVMPSKGKDGTIYFQKISKFQRKPDSDSEERKKADADADDRKSTCLFIAYFYIRIFQIYGSLALTLIDDVRSFVENGVIQSASEYMKSLNKIDLQLGDPLGTVGAPFGQRSIQRGGAKVVANEGKRKDDNHAETVLGDTELRFLLTSTLISSKTLGIADINVKYLTDSAISSRVAYAFRTTVGNVYVNANKPDSANALEEESKGFFLFLLPDSTKRHLVIQLPFTSEMSDVEQNSVKVEFDRNMIACMYNKTVKIPTDPIYNVINGTLGRSQNNKSFVMIRTSSNQYIVQGPRSYDFKLLIQSIFTYLQKGVKDFIQAVITAKEEQTKIDVPEEAVERSMDVRQFMQGRSRVGWDGRRLDDDDRGLFGRDAYGRSYGRDSYDMYGRRRDNRDETLDRFMATDTRAHEALRLSNILSSLRTTRPYAYCVARGLRLLSAVQQATPPGWKTSVCETRFLVDRAGSHDGAPAQDKTIDSSPGIVALSQLFFDTVKSTTSDITMSPQSLRQYTTFLAQMYQLYTGEAPTLSKLDPAEKPLTKIKQDFTQSVCTPNKIATVPNSRVNEVWSRVKALFNRQMVHSAKCGALFKELFFMKRLANGSLYVSIHPNVIKRGIPELDRLTTKAKDLLTKYYVDCENGYKAGMTIIASATAEAAEQKAAEAAGDEAAGRGENPDQPPEPGQGQDPNRAPRDPNRAPRDPNRAPQDPNRAPQDPNQPPQIRPQLRPRAITRRQTVGRNAPQQQQPQQQPQPQQPPPQTQQVLRSALKKSVTINPIVTNQFGRTARTGGNRYTRKLYSNK